MTIQRTKIDWDVNDDGTQGYTLNPIKGKCLFQCKNQANVVYCYATGIYDRFNWCPDVRLEIKVLDNLKELKEPSTVFICSTHELFGTWINDDWVNSILSTTATYQNHRFIFLTKNPTRAIKFKFRKSDWLGTSVTRKSELHRLKELVSIPERPNLFVSFEPLFEDLYENDTEILPKEIKWAICGQESGRHQGKTKVDPAWTSRLIKECEQKNIPIFLKNNLFRKMDDIPPWHRQIPWLSKGL